MCLFVMMHDQHGEKQVLKHTENDHSKMVHACPVVHTNYIHRAFYILIKFIFPYVLVILREKGHKV